MTRLVALLVAVTTAATLGGAAVAKPPLPTVLVDTESSAEDIVDYALAGDRSRVVSTAARLKASADGPAASALARSGVPAATVTELTLRANRVARISRGASFVTVALAANAVSGLMPVLYGRFANRVPASILALDYFDREAELRSLARQPARVALAVEQLAGTWTRVRPKVVAAGGAAEAAAFQQHVVTIGRLEPTSGKQVRAEAARGLELVDRLEDVFVR
jgi:hypothetical protein